MPGPGLAAGPCLLKDTMQLAAFNNNNFTLGHASMMINEGLPMYMVARSSSSTTCPTMTVGILGMAFKAESDDTRVEPQLQAEAAAAVPAPVACSAPIRTCTTTPTSGRSTTCSRESDLLVIATPHKQYADLDVDVPVVDIWNLLGNGERV